MLSSKLSSFSNGETTENEVVVVEENSKYWSRIEYPLQYLEVHYTIHDRVFESEIYQDEQVVCQHWVHLCEIHEI